MCFLILLRKLVRCLYICRLYTENHQMEITKIYIFIGWWLLQFWGILQYRVQYLALKYQIKNVASGTNCVPTISRFCALTPICALYQCSESSFPMYLTIQWFQQITEDQNRSCVKIAVYLSITIPVGKEVNNWRWLLA